MKGKILWPVALGLALTCASLSEAKPSKVEQTRATMHELVKAIRMLLPISVDDDAFRAPKNAPKVRSALRTLSKNAEVLRTHGADNPALATPSPPRPRRSCFAISAGSSRRPPSCFRTSPSIA